ncbi:TetR/AcrR family transcriptional regulator [Acanthopleuribacter pedis]|uniref:TetR/AcrR family transcriptional regulator n=1 Tax=Acanthopleuribacter pedis TaxID=442870 RepID=A0A8J7Q6C7_9BACT|nr:TetR/AcrR family transcriptional regulator [Acanthopleuribacter pedis]MBO1317509.1 TetR/AcrR family transcriptional regulator [Acanthopleuribacter pedis]
MGRGRPIGFDREQALDKALMHFYERGYHGSGMSDLVETMGIARQSLYSAWGDKRGLFMEAVNRYGHAQEVMIQEILDRPGSPLQNIRDVFQVMGQIALDPNSPGCLVGNTIAELNEADEEIKRMLLSHFETITAAIRATLVRAKEVGELPRGVNVRAIASTFCCIAQGLFIATKLEADPEMVKDVLDTAMSLLE